MVNLTPIPRQIQKRMFEKMEALQSHQTSKMAAPNESTDTSERLTFDNMATRTTFIKMVSNQQTPVTLMGGRLKDDGTMYQGYDMYSPRSYISGKGIGETYDASNLAQAVKLKAVMGDAFEPGVSSKGNPKLFEKRKSAFEENFGTPLKKNMVNKNSRPAPGIKSIDVSFKGGQRAMREATVSWTCWDWDELDELMPHFLAHGKTVLLEWGWIYGKKSLLNIPSLADNSGKITENAYKDFTDLVVSGKGDFDAMVGVVKNFEFTTRSDGGFDCQTIITSVGVNLYSNPTPSSGVLDPGTQFRINSKDDEKTLASKLQSATKGDESGDAEKILSLDTNVSLKMFVSKIDDYIKGQFQTRAGTKKRNEVDYKSYKDAEGDFRELAFEPNKFISEIKNKQVTNTWVRWGWFEDNVLNKFLGLTNHEGKYVTAFQSVEGSFVQRGAEQFVKSVKIRNHDDLETTDINNHILPGQFYPQKTTKVTYDNEDYKVEGDSSYLKGLGKIVQENFLPFGVDKTISNPVGTGVLSPEALEQRDNDRLLALEKIISDAGGVDSGVLQPEILDEYNSIRDKQLSQFSSFTDLANMDFNAGEPVGNYGYLRNILVNTKIIRQAFGVQPGGKDITVESINLIETLEYMFDLLNQDLQFWDFKVTVDSQQTARAKIVDDSVTAFNFNGLNRDVGVLEKQSRYQNGEVGVDVGGAFVQELGVFYFPVWRTDSFVKSQNVTAKVPNALQLTAMYGSNMEAVKEVTNPGNAYADKTAVVAGALYNTEPDENKKGLDIAFRNLLTSSEGSKDPIIQYILSQTDVLEEEYEEKLDLIDEQIKQQAKISREQELTDNKYDDSVPPPLPRHISDEEYSKILGYEAKKFDRNFFEKIFGINRGANYMHASKFTPKGRLKADFITTVGYLITEHSEVRQSTQPILVPFDIELEIDGTGGIYPGNSFHSSYLPKRYQKFALFQAFDISHKVDSSGWTTSLTGTMRSTMNTISHLIDPDSKQKKIIDNAIEKQKKLKEDDKKAAIEEREKTLDKIENTKMFKGGMGRF